MLVLTRKPNERILIGENIVLTIVEARPGKVRIGIEAPPEVRVLREEVAKRIQEGGEQQPCHTLSTT